jgi:hypothetical protein
MLVAAVLAPHRAEHAELDGGWFATEKLDDLKYSASLSATSRH